MSADRQQEQTPSLGTTTELEQVYATEPTAVDCDLDGERVILSLEDKHYYGLNPVASQVWAWLREEPRSLTALTDLACLAYAVDEKQARTELEELLGELREHRLLATGPADENREA